MGQIPALHRTYFLFSLCRLASASGGGFRTCPMHLYFIAIAKSKSTHVAKFLILAETADSLYEVIFDSQRLENGDDEPTTMYRKNVPLFIFWITQSKISRFQQFLVYKILRKFAISRL